MANDNIPSPKMQKFNPLWIYGAVAAVLLSVWLTQENTFQRQSITTSTFNNYLEKGYFDEVIVYDKSGSEIK